MDGSKVVINRGTVDVTSSDEGGVYIEEGDHVVITSRDIDSEGVGSKDGVEATKVGPTDEEVLVVPLGGSSVE